MHDWKVLASVVGDFTENMDLEIDLEGRSIFQEVTCLIKNVDFSNHLKVDLQLDFMKGHKKKKEGRSIGEGPSSKKGLLM